MVDLSEMWTGVSSGKWLALYLITRYTPTRPKDKNIKGECRAVKLSTCKLVDLQTNRCVLGNSAILPILGLCREIQYLYRPNAYSISYV